MNVWSVCVCLHVFLVSRLFEFVSDAHIRKRRKLLVRLQQCLCLQTSGGLRETVVVLLLCGFHGDRCVCLSDWPLVWPSLKHQQWMWSLQFSICVSEWIISQQNEQKTIIKCCLIKSHHAAGLGFTSSRKSVTAFYLWSTDWWTIKKYMINKSSFHYFNSSKYNFKFQLHWSCEVQQEKIFKKNCRVEMTYNHLILLGNVFKLN